MENLTGQVWEEMTGEDLGATLGLRGKIFDFFGKRAVVVIDKVLCNGLTSEGLYATKASTGGAGPCTVEDWAILQGGSKAIWQWMPSLEDGGNRTVDCLFEDYTANQRLELYGRWEERY